MWGVGHDAAHVCFVHHEVDRPGRCEPLGRRLPVAAHLGGDVVEIPSGEIGARLGPRQGDAACLAEAARLEHRRCRGVGIDVEPDRLSGPRRVDQAKRFLGAAMIPFASAFVMRDDHGNRRFAADPKRLFERVGDAIAFVAHVRAVHGAGRGQSSGEFDHLFGWCTDRRCIIEPRAHARRPGIESGFQALAHERPLGGAGWAAHVRHRANPQRRVADQADGVDRRGSRSSAPR